MELIREKLMIKHNIYHNESMWKGAPAGSFSKAKRLRTQMTKAETILWDQLKNKQFKGFKFRRQHPIQKYIVDFYCHELKLILEVDGLYHETYEQKAADKDRSEILTFQGLYEIRFTNAEVLNDLEGVLIKLEKKIDKIYKIR